MRTTNAAIDGSGRQSSFVVDTTGNNLILTGVSLTNANAAHVAIVDGSGNQITGFGGGVVSSAKVGQTKISVTGTAVQLTSNTLTNGVIITAKSSNTAPISIGGSGVNNTVDGTGNGYILEAGNSVSFAITNTNILYVNGTSGDIVSFAGS